ncbi:MAG TPA: DUF5666 domain-containing protein, partial [Candidatus Acidoferrum sp.]|nr:DUF5666 domain-containing protein [Candidatus Acidoferrum sp.]
PTTQTHRGPFGGDSLGRVFGPGGLFGGGGFGPGFGDGRGFGGGRFGPGQGAGAITITKIVGSDVSLATADGWSRTFTVSDKTQIQVGSQKGALSDLKVGDTVTIDETKNTDGSYTVTLVVVRVPMIGGTVTGVTSSGFTLKKRDGSTSTVTVTGSTTYLIAGSAGSKAEVTVGTNVTVEGVAGTGDAFTATVVHIAPAVRAGTVTATTADTITIKTRDGSSATIHVDSKTTFRVAGATTSGIADIKVGSVLLAQGTARADGSLDAVSVFSGQFKAPRPDEPGEATPTPPSGG